jgi:glycosyltransferase involved in cell wall biosynthesis
MGGPPNVVMGVVNHLNQIGINVHLVVCGQTKSSFDESVRDLGFADLMTKVYFSKRDSIYGKKLNFFEMKDLLNRIYCADIVILHQIYNFQNIFAAIFCRFLKKKYVLMPHGSLTQYQSQIHKKRKFLAHLLIFNQIINKSQSIFVATNVEKEQILSRYDTRVDRVGIGLSQIPAIPKIYLEKHRNRFLFLGRIAHKKRIDLTLKAFSETKAKLDAGAYKVNEIPDMANK